jgi:hypothetical protein
MDINGIPSGALELMQKTMDPKETETEMADLAIPVTGHEVVRH